MKSLRKKIDRLDKRIVKLLNKRAGCADEIGKIKEKSGLDVYSPAREKQVIENVSKQNPGPLTDEAVTRLYERIIDESRRLERESSEERTTSVQAKKGKLDLKAVFDWLDPRDGNVKHLIELVVGLIVIVVALFLLAFVTPYHRSSGTGTVLTIDRGMPADAVYSEIASQKLISDRLLFKILAKLTGLDHRIKAGKYLLHGFYSDYDVFKIISLGKSNLLVPVTVPPGLTVRQIAGVYHRTLGVDSLEFVKDALGDSMATLLSVPSKNLEGYLFPQTYDFYYGTTPGEIIRRMVDEFDSFFNDSLRLRAHETGYTIPQIIEMASIVEAEAKVDSERPLIASVYYNRLRIGMPLDADPTVEYALHEHSQLYYKDLKIDSPFNTYTHTGLPPTPICSPGPQSIIAALYPDTTKFLYFVANGSGGHRFSETFAQHKHQIREYRRSLMRE
ncbi:MAG: endolytic transglycosylase MltG [Bacteroidetes bacterium]|nr:endolytic transglycosylase MltG [Bacteroidota bacterium]